MAFASCKYDVNSITYLDLLAVRTLSCFFHQQLWKVSIYTCCTSPLSKKLWRNVNVNKNRKQWMSWTLILSTIEHRKHRKSLKCNILLFHRNFKLVFNKNLGHRGTKVEHVCGESLEVHQSDKKNQARMRQSGTFLRCFDAISLK